jgi:hypothetical protein
MDHNKALGTDGFLAEFYQVFWEVIKDDLLALFDEFYQGILTAYSLNFGVITLIPKKETATKSQECQPICLFNVSFKILTKVFTNRISIVAKKVICPTQTAFMSGHNIMEGVSILHEIIHEMYRRELNSHIENRFQKTIRQNKMVVLPTNLENESLLSGVTG